MKRLLLLTVVLIAAASIVSATPCTGATTIAALIATNGTGGCTSQGVTFSNFSYTGTMASNLVLATLVSSSTGGQYSDGWSFGPAHGWTTSFTLGFTVSVTPGNPEGVGQITQTADQIFAGLTGPTNHDAASDIETGGAITPNPLTMIATTGGGESVQTNPYFLTTVTTASNITVVPGHNLSNYEQAFYSAAIPEPVTFVLIGSGLIGLTFLRRRLHKG